MQNFTSYYEVHGEEKQQQQKQNKTKTKHKKHTLVIMAIQPHCVFSLADPVGVVSTTETQHDVVNFCFMFLIHLTD